MELQKALEKANLKIDGLEILIQISEDELKIKIRKRMVPNSQKNEANLSLCESSALCVLFGVTLQAYYDAIRHAEKVTIAYMGVLTLVKEIRTQMAMLGTRKLMYVLEKKLIKHGIKMGRDQLFDLLRFHSLLIIRHKHIARTTDSNHVFRSYPTLIKELMTTGPEQLWVSDITYIRILHGFGYLRLITVVYSRMIVDYSLHLMLVAIGCLKELEMAITGWKHLSPFYLIHHSDRDIVSSKLGETSKELAKIFRKAAQEDCIIFIDEFDSLGKVRDYS